MPRERIEVFMTSPINAILEGLYEANTSIKELKTHGDFGIGTFNDLDGELVLLDGKAYQLDGEGKACTVSGEELTPFATACFMEPVCDESIVAPLDYSEFNSFLEQCLPSPNLFYALRIDGVFDSVRTRSVLRTANYTPLVEATADLKTKEFGSVAGTLVGFYTPDFLPSVNVPGFHFHFINENRNEGGHLLECSIREGTLSIQFFHQLNLNLPVTLDYLGAEFGRDARKDIEQAER